MNYLNKITVRCDRTVILCVKYFFLVAHDLAVGVDVFNGYYAHFF